MIQLRDVEFEYPRGDFELRIGEWSVPRRQKLAVVGPSGCGKTTLLNLLAGISVPMAGTVEVDGERVSAMSDARRRDFRAARIGFVFQQFELIEYLSVEENILLPLLINPSLRISAAARERARQLAGSMGLADKLRRGVRRLSQGEQQRVAICRALMTEPPLILADEPTGNLDPRNKHRTIELLSDYCDAHEATLIVVTHDTSLLGGFDATVDFECFRRETAA
jgi:putative ABC transport system ATP-binding protein